MSLLIDAAVIVTIVALVLIVAFFVFVAIAPHLSEGLSSEFDGTLESTRVGEELEGGESEGEDTEVEAV